jgi:hypothetical protein
MAHTYPRGVWTLPYRNASGERLAVCVNSDGNRLAEMSYTCEQGKPAIIRSLWTILHAADPVARLRVG